MEFRSVWTQVHGLSVHAKAAVEPEADRPALVLVHGLDLSHRYMMPTAERLTANFDVYVPDLPGFGESQHPRKVLGIPELADALLAWMDSVGVGRASLLGNSQACQIIADLAARWPHRVGGVILQGPTAPPEERGWIRQFIRWRQNWPYNPPELDPMSFEDYRKAGYIRSLRTFRLSLLDRLEDKLPKMTMPVLVVRGQFDPICNGRWAEQVARLLPDGRLVEIPGVAHTLIYTAAEQLAWVAVAFLLPEGAGGGGVGLVVKG